MRQIDMSREAVTNRLKLASELRRLCLSLATARIRELRDRDSKLHEENKAMQKQDKQEN